MGNPKSCSTFWPLSITAWTCFLLAVDNTFTLLYLSTGSSALYLECAISLASSIMSSRTCHATVPRSRVLSPCSPPRRSPRCLVTSSLSSVFRSSQSYGFCLVEQHQVDKTSALWRASPSMIGGAMFGTNFYLALSVLPLSFSAAFTTGDWRVCIPLFMIDIMNPSPTCSPFTMLMLMLYFGLRT